MNDSSLFSSPWIRSKCDTWKNGSYFILLTWDCLLFLFTSGWLSVSVDSIKWCGLGQQWCPWPCPPSPGRSEQLQWSSESRLETRHWVREERRETRESGQWHCELQNKKCCGYRWAQCCDESVCSLFWAGRECWMFSVHDPNNREWLFDLLSFVVHAFPW